MKNRILKSVLILMLTSALVLCSANELSQEVLAADDYIYFLQDTICFSEDEGLALIPYVVVREGYWAPTAYFNIQDITANFNADYNLSTNKISGRYSGTYGLMTIIFEDDLIEGDEQYVLTFTSGDFMDDPANGYYASCTVTITDNDEVEPPDSCVLGSSAMLPSSNSITSTTSRSFEIQHVVEITDTSAAGLGWELFLKIDDTIHLTQNSVDDPCLPGFCDYIQADIPAQICISSITLTSLEFPDSTIDDTDVLADLTNLQSSDNTFSIEVSEDGSGDTGTFIATIKIIINFDKWLPAGTVITAGGNGSRFDGSPGDTGDNDYVVQSGDMIQIFAGIYSCVIEYEAVRPSAP